VTAEALTYDTEQFVLPPEPPLGTVVVRAPDRGGPYWERDDAESPCRWRQSKRGDHRHMTWGEVLQAAGGRAQILKPLAGFDT
jgi:hypothetical protein